MVNSCSDCSTLALSQVCYRSAINVINSEDSLRYAVFCRILNSDRCLSVARSLQINDTQGSIQLSHEQLMLGSDIA